MPSELDKLRTIADVALEPCQCSASAKRAGGR